MKEYLRLVKKYLIPIILIASIIILTFVSIYILFDSSVSSEKVSVSSDTQKVITSEAISGNNTQIARNQNITANDNGALYWLFGGMLVLTIVSMIIALKLLLWRKALGDGQMSIVPGELLSDFKTVDKAIHKQEKGFDALINKLSEYMGTIVNHHTLTHQNTDDIKEALTVFQLSLNKKDAEIERLKKGSDAEVFRRFLNRFVRLHHSIQEEIDELENSNNEKEILCGIQALLEDALYECGVEQFQPTVGEHLTQAFGVAEQKSIIETNDESKDLQIAEIKKPGFLLSTPEGNICLQGSVVTIYKFINEESE